MSFCLHNLDVELAVGIVGLYRVWLTASESSQLGLNSGLQHGIGNLLVAWWTTATLPIHLICNDMV